MKKNILIIAAIAVSTSALFLAGCSKDDTTPPVITLNGSASVTVSLNGSYTDAGATATDDNDGTVTVTSDVSATNPNANAAATYTITYTAVDAAGNTGTATRTVIVRNDAYALAASYSVHDTIPPVYGDTYPQTITASTTLNNDIVFNKFANYSGNTNIHATVAGSTVTIPLQTATGIGTASEEHQFSSTSGTISGTTITINYTDKNVTAGTPTQNGTMVFTKL